MRILWILIALGAPVPASAQDDEDTRATVVVVPLRSKPAIAGIEVLTEELRTQVARHGGYRLVTPEEMNSIDGELQRQLAGGCDEASCIAELGGALGARYLITGRIGKLGSTFSLNIKLIDIEKVSAANAASAHGKSVEDFFKPYAGDRHTTLRGTDLRELFGPCFEQPTLRRAGSNTQSKHLERATL